VLCAWLKEVDVSVEGLARSGFTHGLLITAQGLDKRFDARCAAFLKGVLEAAFGVEHTEHPELLTRFSAITLADCSTVSLPKELVSHYRGVGRVGEASEAGVKLDVQLELKSGLLQVNLLDGCCSDQKSQGAMACDEAGHLHLKDLGYFNLARMNAQNVRGGYWISRYQPRTQLFAFEMWLDLTTFVLNLSKQGITQYEFSAKLGKQEQLPARCLLWKVPEQQAQRRRAKMKTTAQNNGYTASSASLALCDWNIMITNVPATMLNFEEVYLLYRLRWQIECLFKLWKSHGRLDQSRSQKPYRILCEFYSKLLVVLVLHWLCLLGLWQKQNKSLVKGCQLLREQSPRLAACLDNREALLELLNEFTERFEYGCSLNPRKKQPNSYQRIVNKRVFC
jgi:hypothetical protein